MLPRLELLRSRTTEPFWVEGSAAQAVGDLLMATDVTCVALSTWSALGINEQRILFSWKARQMILELTLIQF